MTKFKHQLLLKIVKIADAVLIIITFAMCWLVYDASRVASPFYAKGNYLAITFFFIFCIAFGGVYDEFLMSMKRIFILAPDLTLVTPRPEHPVIAAEHQKELPEFALRLQAKASLIGYVQVYGKCNTTPYDKIQMDLMYIAHPSAIEDLKILFVRIVQRALPKHRQPQLKGKRHYNFKQFREQQQ